MHPTSRFAFVPRLRAWLLSAVLASVGSASAYDGFTVGLAGGLPDGGAYVLNVRAVQPVASATVSGTPLQFSARADLTAPLSFDVLPAVGLAAVTSADEAGIERYLGLGAGFALAPGANMGPLWSGYGLAGYRVPIVAGLFGVVEVQLTGNALFVGSQVAVALEYGFGGER